MGERSRLFISYAKEDLAEVNLIAAFLVFHGIECDYWDKSKVPGEKDWEQIEKWIKRDRYFTVIVTQNAIKSSSVNQEVGIAKRSGAQITPFQLEKVDPRKLGVLQGITPIDVSKEQLTEGAENLATNIIHREKYRSNLEKKIKQIRVYLNQQKIEERRKKESENFWKGVVTGIVSTLIIITLWPKIN
ncbi:MAG: toll/interleukin-1 receptor domain-containing protein [Candidatus Aerophobetes bacterium]|nr:toll/interleukin-1 receptor domain-containing protein [Candidatus Aerophobetes bacterium]